MTHVDASADQSWPSFRDARLRGYNSGLFSEVLVYHDEESINFEDKGRESGIVRFDLEMLEGLKIVEDQAQEQAGSTE